MSQAPSVSFPSSMHNGSVYLKVHDKATPQSGDQYVDTQDVSRKSVNNQIRGGRIIYLVQEGTKSP
ncbi:hypothetical protein D3C78_1417330 [compost metagenome]